MKTIHFGRSDPLWDGHCSAPGYLHPCPSLLNTVLVVGQVGAVVVQIHTECQNKVVSDRFITPDPLLNLSPQNGTFLESALRHTSSRASRKKPYCNELDYVSPLSRRKSKHLMTGWRVFRAVMEIPSAPVLECSTEENGSNDRK
jgi:hypothetical protein